MGVADYGHGNGDSGAPVFSIQHQVSGANGAYLQGIHWGNAGGQAVFSLYRRGADRPREGTYPIVLDYFMDPGVQGFNAIYSRGYTPQGETNEWSESYIAQSGEVAITRSSTDRVEGTFTMTGFRYCAHQDNMHIGPCMNPRGEVIPGAPTIEVSGSFSVTYEDFSDITAGPEPVP